MRIINCLKYYTGCFVLTVLLLLAGAGSLPVRAEGGGSIELQLPKEAAGAEITLYAVAEITEGTIHYHEPFGGTGFSILDLRDAQKVEQAAEQFALLAAAEGVSGISGTADESGILRFSGLNAALYLAVQTSGTQYINIQKALIPVPYTREDGTLCEQVELAPKYSIPDGAVILYKTDEKGTAVGDVQFVLQKKTYISDGGTVPEGMETGQDVDGRFVWEDCQTDLKTNGLGQLCLSGLSFGMYRFVEKQTPGGFILNESPVYFSVDQAGQVEETNGSYRVVSGKVPEVTVVNQRTSVTVNKVDSKGNAVAGARLVLKDSSGKVILDENGVARYAFTTTENPTVLKQLPPGEYYLCEVESPEGYTVAQDVKLTVSDAKDAVNTVTMVDEKEKAAKTSLRVTKNLMDMEDRALAAVDSTFYVALFSDAARTHRVSDVKALHYVGSSSETAVFENLAVDTDYYIGETTLYGDLLDGDFADGKNFTPVYPDGYKIRLTAKKTEAELSFRNVFFELPQQYYYEGNLTITKKVMKGTRAYDCDDVFYAGIFTDAQYTDRYGEVIALEMNGESETSVTVPVSAGETIDGSVTYYVTETDETGKPLAGTAGLEFEIQVDHTSVTLTPGQTEGSVTITNTYQESSSSGSGSGSHASSGGSGGSSSSHVRTGDDTPLLKYGLLMAVSGTAVVLLILGIVLSRSRRKKKRKNS